MSNIFESKEFDYYFDFFYDNLLQESDRGAIIIGAAVIEEQLEDYFKKILPKKGVAFEKKLFNNGVFGSFSSKIEVAYSLRFISKTLYQSLNSLRKIRNTAAHVSSEFKWSDNTDLFENIFDLGPNVKEIIRSESLKTVVRLKHDAIQIIFQELKLSIEEQEIQVKRIVENNELMGKIESQVPKWQLILGLTMISCMIKNSENQTLICLGESLTWGN
jgi:DNA-binding MltR family transcriptional regulator